MRQKANRHEHKRLDEKSGDKRRRKETRDKMRWKQKNKQGKGEEMEEETNRDQAKNLNVKRRD